MPKGLLKDEEDVLAENMNDFMFLSLGFLSVAVPVIIAVYTLSIALSGPLLLADLPSRVAVSVVFIVVGMVLFRVFRKRRQIRKERNAAFFHD